ncbi:MAG: alpha/beta fold hydrolase [Longimicrobiales bacterium]|nr:alpha/beta fold hydrolase [Longimicrobiales bacterium]
MGRVSGSEATGLEEAVSFGSGKGLVGILHRTAPDAPRGIPILILNAGIIHRVGPNRLHVELARALAARGHPVLRFDLSGVGDSAPPRSSDLRASVMADVSEAVDEVVRWTGAERCVVAGLCAGADNAFAAALRDPRIGGVVCVDGTTFRTRRFHLRRFLDRVSNRRSWVAFFQGKSAVWKLFFRLPSRILPRRIRPREASTGSRRPAFYGMSAATREETAAGLDLLLSRGVRLLYVFTGGIRARYNHATQFVDALPEVTLGKGFQLEYLPEADHTFHEREQRRRLTGFLLEWLANGKEARHGIR